MLDYTQFDSIITNDPNHPRGKWKNESYSNSGDGTVVRAEFFMDIYAFIFGLMVEQNVQASEAEETTVFDGADSKQVWSVMEEFARPTGSIYIEYPSQTRVASLYPRLIFTNVSASYAGSFFRVSGGSAASFGTLQQDAGRNITGSFWTLVTASQANEARDFPLTGAFRATTTIKQSAQMAGNDNRTVRKKEFNASRVWTNAHTAAEFRPVNYAIRMFKKTGVSAEE